MLKRRKVTRTTVSERNAEIIGVKRVEDILTNLDDLANQCILDEQKRVILANKAIVESNFTLQTILDANVYQSKRVVSAIQDLNKSTKYTEKVMIGLTVAQIVLAIASICVAISFRN